MIDLPDLSMQTAAIFENYIDWLLNILSLTGLSLGSIFLICFVIWLVKNLLLSILEGLFPFLRRLMKYLNYIFFPGSLLHMAWHSFAAKKLNIPTEMFHSFGFGWSRSGIKTNRSFKNLREAFLFYYAPALNLFIIVGWIYPGMILFQWLDTISDTTFFYWFWLYLLFSFIMFSLPDLSDLTNPVLLTIVKTPEFYLFVVFYVLLAPLTLILWGYGIMVLFSLGYALIGYYELYNISKNEEKRLAKTFDKISSSTKTKIKIVSDREYSD